MQAGINDNEDKIFAEDITYPDKFAVLNRLVLRDLNNYRDLSGQNFFSLFSKRDIANYLKRPERHERELRRAVRFIYNASSHFRRIIQYFVGLTDLSYIVEAYKIDPKRASERIVRNNYRRVVNTLSSMSIKTQFPKILTVVLREDVFYGTMWVTPDDIVIQQLPSEFCAISSVEGKVCNVSFNFIYFDRYPYRINNYPPEFKEKYDQYRNGRFLNPWIELDSPTSFAIKCNTDILRYAIPPFIGVLRDIYELEDYKKLKLAKTALDNYAMLVMNLPLTDEGEWGIDYNKAMGFYGNLDKVTPDEIGTVLSPMKIDKISFERSRDNDKDTITNAERNLFTAAGVSSLLFNSDSPSANALLLSIKVDQTFTYGIVKSIQDVINRYIQAQSYGKNFKVNFLDVSTFNRKEVGEAYLKAATYGLPTICAYAASQGIGQAELDSMSYLEGTVLGLQDMFRQIVSSTQVSADEINSNPQGAPEKDPSELTDSGEQSSEQKDNWG